MEKEKTLQNEEPKQKKPKLGMLESNRISVLATEDFKFPDTLIFEDLGPDQPLINDVLIAPVLPDKQQARMLFTRDYVQCDVFDSNGNLPIHMAVLANNPNLVRRQCFMLKIMEVSIDSRNRDSYTPLHLAVIHQVNSDILDVLLANGADVSALDHNGNNVLHLAVVGSDLPMLKHLLGFDGTWSDQINEHNSNGLTPLIHTVITNQMPLARCLLENDADPNVYDKKSGRTPLFYAIEENNLAIVKLLLENSAATHVRNFYGYSSYEALSELDNVDTELSHLVWVRWKEEKRLRLGNNPVPSAPRRGGRRARVKCKQIYPERFVPILPKPGG